MGCLKSKQPEEKKEEEKEKPVFSWERRDRPNPEDFTIADLQGVTVGRTPGKVNGQQFIIRDCQDCNIYIFDNSACITVDDCVNCKIFLGPSKGSVFLRDCKDCKLVVACQQFRTRDCKKIDTFMCCSTQPIIESSSGMKFGCFQYHYPELEGQFEAAGLSVYDNNWSNIHDFTPAAGENTWTLLPEDVEVEDCILRFRPSAEEFPGDANVEDYVPLPSTEEFSGVEISTDRKNSVVPLTLGSRRKCYNESCLVVFFSNGNMKRNSRKFLDELRLQDACTLVQSKEVKMGAGDANRVFRSQEFSAAAERGPVVGLEINGDSCIAKCKEIISRVCGGSDRTQVYLSQTEESAAQDIDNFYNFVDMAMT